MTKLAFTPGPWRTMDDGVSAFVEIVADTEDGFVSVACANDYGDTPPDDLLRMKANAALIAAAPELYEALTMLLPYFEGEHHPDHPDVVRARAALSKAAPAEQSDAGERK